MLIQVRKLPELIQALYFFSRAHSIRNMYSCFVSRLYRWVGLHWYGQKRGPARSADARRNHSRRRRLTLRRRRADFEADSASGRTGPVYGEEMICSYSASSRSIPALVVAAITHAAGLEASHSPLAAGPCAFNDRTLLASTQSSQMASRQVN